MSHSREYALQIFVAKFVHSYAAMNLEERLILRESLNRWYLIIGEESFEDDQDFTDFLHDKLDNVSL